jgi:hypothetical protein
VLIDRKVKHRTAVSVQSHPAPEALVADPGSVLTDGPIRHLEANNHRAAQLLGMKPTTLASRIKALGILPSWYNHDHLEVLRSDTRAAHSSLERTILQHFMENSPVKQSVSHHMITFSKARKPREKGFGHYFIVHAYDESAGKSVMMKGNRSLLFESGGLEPASLTSNQAPQH